MSIQARKRFGQHFLHDKTVIKQIVDYIAPVRTDHIVEIGPGLGALTSRLLPHVNQLTVVELDRDLIPELQVRCQGLGELVIHQGDALQFDFSTLTTQPRSLRLVGNLPYNISTPLLFHLIRHANVIKDMFFMLQKEVVDRIVAKPGQEAYGRLSVMMQYYCHVDALFYVKPNAFTPPPKVDSAVIKLVPHTVLPFMAQDPICFADVVRLSFNQRRKTLRNSLQTLLTAEQISAAGVDPNLRAERLSVQDYVNIANTITIGNITI